jgi:hypothetical protein
MAKQVRLRDAEGRILMDKGSEDLKLIRPRQPTKIGEERFIYRIAGVERMVNRQEIIRFWKQRPFRAFRVYLANGDVYVIRHPELLLVFETHVAIGVPVPNHPLLLCERVERPSFEEIVQLEYLPASATLVSS